MKGVDAPYLFTLRNEGLAASLDQQIARRKSLYLDKFLHSKKIHDLMNIEIPKTVSNLEDLESSINSRAKEIEKAYKDKGLTGVLDSTISETTAPKSTTTNRTSSRVMAMVSGEFDKDTFSSGKLVTEITANKKPIQEQKMPRSGSVPVSYTHLTLPTNREV